MRESGLGGGGFFVYLICARMNNVMCVMMLALRGQKILWCCALVCVCLDWCGDGGGAAQPGGRHHSTCGEYVYI